MEEPRAYPEVVAEARGLTGCAALTMLSLCVLGMAAVIPAEMRHLVVWLVRGIRSGNLPPQARATLPSLFFALIGVAALFGGGLIGWSYRTWLGLRWRGNDVRLGPDGVTIGRGEQARRWAWDQIARIPVMGRELILVTRTGQTIAIPLLAFDGVKLRCGGKWRRVLTRYLIPITRAYWSAARRGLEAALNEPPRMYMGYVRHRARTPAFVWFTLVSVLVMWVCMSLSMALMPGPMSLGERVAVLAILQVATAGGLALLWRMGKRQGASSIRVDGRGIEVRTRKGKCSYRWEDISEMWRPFGAVADVAIRVNGKRVELPTVRYVLGANLSLLMAAKRLLGSQMLLACYRHYKAATG